jgi:hypothetical protein
MDHAGGGTNSVRADGTDSLFADRFEDHSGEPEAFAGVSWSGSPMVLVRRTSPSFYLLVATPNRD